MTDPIVALARWLAEHVEWLRHRAEVDEAYRDFAECASRLRHVVDGPAAKKYLGPCGAWRDHDSVCGCEGTPGCQVPETCEGDVYGRVDAKHGTCRTCGARVDQAERRLWLTEQAQRSDLLWTARGIADALGINPKTVRAWATDRYSGDALIRRAKLSTYWRDGNRIVPWVKPRPGEDTKARGPRLHYVADVVQLAVQAAQQRDARESERAPRQETAA